MKPLFISILFVFYFFKINAQHLEAPTRFPLPGEPKGFCEIPFFSNGPEFQKPNYVPLSKSGTIYIDTLYPARQITFFYDVNDFDSAYYVSGYTYNNRSSANYDPYNLTLLVRMKLDYYGAVEWQRVDSLMHGDHFTMFNNSLIQLSDGNFLQMGSVNEDYTNWRNYDYHSATYTKFDSDGDIIWQKLYKDTLPLHSGDWAMDIIPEEDKGFTSAVLLGSDTKHTNQYDTSDHYLYVDSVYLGIIRYDSLGNIKNRKKYFVGGNKTGSRIGLLMKQPDNGYIIGGINVFVQSSGLFNYYLMKVDSNLNRQWTKTFGQTVDYNVKMKLIPKNNGQYYFSVNRADTPIVYDPYGNMYYNGYYQTGIMDSAFSIIKDTVYDIRFYGPTHPYYNVIYDGGTIQGMSLVSQGIGVCMVSSLGYGASLVKLDSNLNFQWNRWIADFPYFTEEPTKLRLAHDGGFIISGITNRFGIGGWFVKTDSLGFALPNGGDTLYHIGIGEQTEQNIGFRVYPNPTSDRLNIVFEEIPKGSIQLRLYDLTGRLIERKQNDGQKNFTLDVNDLKRGVYMLNIKLDNGWSKSVKVIKN